ncbi:uncharacterized protein LOC106472564 [Limulus polyphemus]|uniref:Uncharacterized protein LOC106472564 n=1 Tax=Limulus polyphemus TaxID=6850 RepID=A0ABM1BU33_LIMPO|nr:uncharacterized protein LOC106472564 [Limulus polyphemus]XP_013788672.1 uncharacterized protein LOC106472564 [Limulus polyphemus]
MERVYFSETNISNDTETMKRLQLATDEERAEWKKMNQNYVKVGDFLVGVTPGDFYEGKHGYIVEMGNGLNFEIMLKTFLNSFCNVDLYVDGKMVACLQLKPHQRVNIDGPQDSDNKFVFLRAKDAPVEAGITFGLEDNGIIEAVFIPQKLGIQERVSVSTISVEEDECALNNQLLSILDNVLGHPEVLGEAGNAAETFHGDDERGISRSVEDNWCSGAVALQGKQSKKQKEKATDIETDENKKTIIYIRLVTKEDDDPVKLDPAKPIIPLASKKPPPLF